MIVGTAGHVDHGKTSLVKALTGIDTDRLEEEKRRGITIELGFAHWRLPDGEVAGVVDVPGHERFVRAMAAGAGGVDVAVLAVAVDEGVMPQTREHLDICQLLGVRAGVIALTKADLLEGLGAEWLALVQAELDALTQGTFLEKAPRVCCSSRTGEGLEALGRSVARVSADRVAREVEGPAFLPIDRVFTSKGFGTVVTGTLLSGRLELEQPVACLPGLPGPLRLRGLQVHGVPVASVGAGQRVAVNVADVEAARLSRGSVLVRAEEVPESRILDVALELLPQAEAPLPRRSRWQLHLGTAQVDAVVALLEGEALAPGATALAQLRLAEPTGALPGQRFILRGTRSLEGRGATLAGGRVLAVASPRRRRHGAEVLRPLLDASAHQRLGWLLTQAGVCGLTAKALFARAGLPLREVERALSVGSSRGEWLLVDKPSRRYLARTVLERLSRRALHEVRAFHDREPLQGGLGKEELRQRLGLSSERVFERVKAHLLEGGELELDADRFRLPGRERRLTASQQTARALVEGAIAAGGLGPPSPAELARELRLPLDRLEELLHVAVAEGTLVCVAAGLFYDPSALAALRERLIAYLQEKGTITTLDFKALVGQSRKFVIPLSEYFDREQLTLRAGNVRKLRHGGGRRGGTP